MKRENLKNTISDSIPKDSERNSPKGFALIASLSIMVLLVMVTIGMLSLATSEVRQSVQDKSQLEARANARVALAIALSQLQEYIGPDQRTTATAGIFDDNAWTEEIEEVANPHYLGVWRTDGVRFSDINAGIINDENGRLLDKRSVDKTSADTQCLKWLVSGDVTNFRDDLTGDEGVDFLTIARDPSTPDSINNVKVPLVNIQSDGSQSGSYAYWVSDENLKAKINLTDPNKEENPDWSDPENGGFNRLLTPASNNLDDTWAEHSNLTDENRDKIVSNESVELVFSYKPATSTFHDFTTHSYSLLVNLRDGGLQQDLTGYLESNGSVPAMGKTKLGIADTDPIISGIQNRETISPRFSALRSWYDLADEVTGKLGSRSIEPQLPNMVDSRPALASVAKQQVTPVMTEAMLYMRHTFDGHKPVALYYPRVVLWNPYNVKLKSKGYFVYFHFNKNNQMKIRYKDPDNNKAITETSANMNFNFGYNWQRRPIFYVEPTELEPGEALVFTAKSSPGALGGKATKLAYQGTDLRNNRLSAEEDPVDKLCYYSELHMNGFGGSLPNKVDMKTVSYYYPGEVTWNGSNESQSVKLYADEATSSIGYNDLATPKAPEVSAMRFDNFSRGNNGRWGPSYTPPSPQLTKLADALAANPETLVHFGGRMRWFRPDYSNLVFGQANKEPWYTAPMAFGNARSPNHFRWLRDNMYGQRYDGAETGTGGARAHLYSYGMVAQTRQATEWLDPEVMPSLAPSGKYRTAVFQSADTTNAFRTFPMFEIPDKEVGVFSLAQLAHAQVSRYWWQPTYPIGNSLAPINVPLESTALDNANNQEEDEKKDKLSTLIQSHNNHITQLDTTNGNPLTTDLSFELNYELWDRFFLSGLSYSQDEGGWSDGKWPEDQPLPNPRMVLNTDNERSGDFAETADFNKAASSLLINGGFNVNSVSVKAWTALLKSFRGIELPQRDGEKSDTSYVFSRLLVPTEGGPKNGPRTFSNTYQENALWNGYRSLSDDHINDLAQRIVTENKRRGPSLTLSDFVNRRLSGEDNETRISRSGPLQKAIDGTGINIRLDNKPDTESNMPKASSAKKGSNFIYGAPYWGGPSRTPETQTYESFNTWDNENRSRSKATGAPGYLMASDVLQQIGSVIRGRSDTFVIRAYGDSRDQAGKVLSHAYCEAVIQRTTEPIDPDPATNDMDPMPPVKDQPHYGRRCKIISFRWLSNDEI